MSRKSSVISAETFFNENPLWKLLKLGDGKLSASYKSNVNEYFLECKECGEQIERRGSAGFKCTRCRRTVELVDDNKFVIVEPTDEKDLALKEKNMARDPKKLTGLDAEESSDKEEPVKVVEPVKTRKTRAKKVVVPAAVPEDSEAEEEPTEPKEVFLDLNDLAALASKASGYLTPEELVEKEKIVARKNSRRAAKKADREQREIEEVDNINEDEEPSDSILPERKEKERCKVKECRGVVNSEIILKSGESYYIAELGLMIRAE